MNMYAQNKGGNSILALLMVGLFFVALFFLAKGVFAILSWVAPILLIITLFMNYNVVLDYGKMLINWTKTNPFMGIVAIVLSFVAFPFVAAFLFAKALLYRKVDKLKENMQKAEEGEFTEYEELEDDDPLILDDVYKPKQKQPEILKETKGNDNAYDQLFE